MDPGSSAMVLVPFAITGDSTASKAGNVSSVPPPAMALIAPAKNALMHNAK